MSGTEHRRQNRDLFQCKLRVYWKEENGRENYAVANTVDISGSGMCIIIPNRIELRTYVLVKSDKHPELSGTASVRYCVRKGLNFAVGLEFSGGAKLKAPNPE